VLAGGGCPSPSLSHKGAAVGQRNGGRGNAAPRRIGYVEVLGGEMNAAELRRLVEKLVKAEIAG
jgi:hypothetical protein